MKRIPIILALLVLSVTVTAQPPAWCESCVEDCVDVFGVPQRVCQDLCVEVCETEPPVFQSPVAEPPADRSALLWLPVVAW